MLAVFLLAAAAMTLQTRAWVRDGFPWQERLWTAADFNELNRLGISLNGDVNRPRGQIG
jgi:hypothetical protein